MHASSYISLAFSSPASASSSSLWHISSFVGVGGFSVSSFSVSASFLIFNWNSASSSACVFMVMLLLPLRLPVLLLLRMFVLVPPLLLVFGHGIGYDVAYFSLLTHSYRFL